MPHTSTAHRPRHPRLPVTALLLLGAMILGISLASAPAEVVIGIGGRVEPPAPPQPQPAQPEDPDAFPLIVEGPLHSLRDEVSKLMDLHIVDGKLQLNRPAWEAHTGAEREALNRNQPNAQQGNIQIRAAPGIQQQQIIIRGGLQAAQTSPAEQIFSHIQGQLGGIQSTSVRSGTAGRSMSFRGQTLGGSIETAGDSVIIHFAEQTGSQRTIEIQETQVGTLRLLAGDAYGNTLLLIATPQRVQVIVAGDKPGHTAIHHARSFLALCRDNPTFARDVLYPTLRSLGIKPPLTADQPQVQQAVLALIQPIDADIDQHARKLLRDLDSDDFQTREDATAALIQRYEQFKPLIQEAREKPDTSAEARERLTHIVQEAASDAADLQNTIRDLKLTTDPAYLVTLFEVAKGPQRQHLAQHLSKLTGQTLGPDPDAWQQWLNTRDRDTKPTP